MEKILAEALVGFLVVVMISCIPLIFLGEKYLIIWFKDQLRELEEDCRGEENEQSR